MSALRHDWARPLAAVAAPLMLLALWELGARTGVVDTRFFSQPSEIFQAFKSLVASGELWDDLRASLVRIALGFAIGVIPGVVIGTVMGLSRWARALLGPLVAVVFPIPKIAILPLLLIMFGIGESSKIALIALGAVFLTLYNTLSGVRNLPPLYAQVAESFGATRWQYIYMVALPGAIPHVLTGLRLSLQTSLLLIVSAEFVGAKDGIGYLIWSSWEIFAVARMFVGLVVLSLLGYLLSTALEWVEHRALFWREAGKG